MTFMDNVPLPKNYWAGFYSKNKQAADSILAKLNRQGVLEGLTARNREQLANHVLTISRHYNWRRQIGPWESWQSVWFRRGPGQLRKLRNKAKKLKQDFEDLRAYAAGIGVSGPEPSGNVYLAKVLDERFQLGHRLAETGAALHRLRIPPDAVFKRRQGPLVSVSDPTSSATRVLADFFTAECGLTTNDASQRSAKVGNAMWGWNIRDDDVSSHTPERSDAIRKRLKRRPSTAR